MKKLFLVSLMVILVVGLILGGCTKKTTSPTTTTTQTSTSTTKTAPHKVLKIGSAIGLNSPQGIEQKKWYELFAKLINEQGGWKIGYDTYDVEMIIYDTQNDPAKSKNYLEKLVLQDGVKFILGSPTGNPTTDAEVTEPNKVICFGFDVIGSSADPKIQYYYTPLGMMFFGRGYIFDMDKNAVAKGWKNYAALKSDDMIGRMADKWCNETWAVAAPSVEYLGTVYYDAMNTTDFGPIATKLMTLNADVVDFQFCSNSVAPTNALYDVGYKGCHPPDRPYPLDTLISHCGTAFPEGAESGLKTPE